MSNSYGEEGKNMDIEKSKKWIAGATYKELLSHWRFAPVGDPMFIGELGQFYVEELHEKKSMLASGEDVQASKDIGWN